MMASTASRYVELAKQLHPRLQRFLAKYPPNQILPKTTRENTIKDGATPNPFLPHKHPATGKWQEPEFSLRRQAELVKLAREAGIEELLPFTHKGTEERIRKRVEEGLQVKGTGVGQKVKGHLHERMLAAKYAPPSPHPPPPVPPRLARARPVDADDACLQDEQEERRHVGHAETGQRVAEGKSHPQVAREPLWHTDAARRRGPRGGGSGRDKGHRYFCSGGTISTPARRPCNSMYELLRNQEHQNTNNHHNPPPLALVSSRPQTRGSLRAME